MKKSMLFHGVVLFLGGFVLFIISSGYKNVGLSITGAVAAILGICLIVIDLKAKNDALNKKPSSTVPAALAKKQTEEMKAEEKQPEYAKNLPEPFLEEDILRYQYLIKFDAGDGCKPSSFYGDSGKNVEIKDGFAYCSEKKLGKFPPSYLRMIEDWKNQNDKYFITIKSVFNNKVLVLLSFYKPVSFYQKKSCQLCALNKKDSLFSDITRKENVLAAEPGDIIQVEKTEDKDYNDVYIVRDYRMGFDLGEISKKTYDLMDHQGKALIFGKIEKKDVDFDEKVICTVVLYVRDF